MVTVEGFMTHHIGALIGRIVLYMELKSFMVVVSKPFSQDRIPNSSNRPVEGTVRLHV
ncbi:hypothetical protein RHMOL_Rhmol01G0179300 [Rhododendron molle]|uniref:Uncharacterized protein n=1 Tax=Rhododendron molle TaxID=49168 RepID=A0ACC0Q3A6_RHOML|nr:hypothetical protein RHMOL_Rhmol01G0179300 [Rhododendron molle]